MTQNSRRRSALACVVGAPAPHEPVLAGAAVRSPEPRYSAALDAVPRPWPR
ncbi:hypothetical protein [Blastococcus jejuensis]|uniref:hypothetical protein n=1 Tax=Blastococcus jejuensis TaxID=351224 RepID=UPI0031DA4855